MTAFPRTFLFPDWRLVVGWTFVGLCLAIVNIYASFLGGTKGILVVLCTAAFGALWADDCVRRMRSWSGSAFVPGYTRTAFLTAIGVVVVVAALPTIGFLMLLVVARFLLLPADPLPPVDPEWEELEYRWFLERLWEVLSLFGPACLVGVSSLFGLTYARRQAVRRPLLFAVGLVLFVTLFVTVSPEMPRWVESPAIQGLALIPAVVVAFLLKKRLAHLRPTWDGGVAKGNRLGLYPFVIGPLHAFRDGTRLALVEVLLIAATVGIAVELFDVVSSEGVGTASEFIRATNAAALAVFLAAFLCSLTPLVLLKGVGNWMATAWQLGTGDSRRELGRRFAFRVVAATFVALGLAAMVVSTHAFLGPDPSSTGHGDYVDELLVLGTAGLVAFTWACAVRRRRTTRQPSQASALAIVCVAVLAVAFSGLSLQWPDRAILLLLLAVSALLAVTVGGRMISRIDFLPARDD